MRELRFDGLSPDGARLVLAGKDGQKYSVVIDERLEAAVRRDRARISQVEIEQAGMLRPREIQARIRAGATAEDVAASSGLPLEHIRRFEGPVLTERAWVAQQAQATEVRRPGGDIELGDLVAERLHSMGVDPADIAWDAWRRDDGLWVVIATFPIEPNTHVASWTYDSSSRTMTVADDNARALSSINAEAPVRLAPTRPKLSSVAPLDEDDESAAAFPDVPDESQDEAAEQAWGDEAGTEGSAAEVSVAERAESEGSWESGEDDPGGDDSGRDDSGGDADSSADGPTAHEPHDADEDPAADDEAGREGPTEAGTAAGEDAEDAGGALFDAPAHHPSAHRGGGKPAVPSFDDILFGPGPSPKK